MFDIQLQPTAGDRPARASEMFNHNGRVRDQQQYDAGIQNHIRENARIGRQRRWLAEDNTRNALIAALYEAANRAREGSFVVKMVEAYGEWGSLTAGQEAAVRRIVAQNAERQQQRTEARAREAANSQHIGTVDKRQDFTLTIRVRLEFENDFGSFYVHIMSDPSGNCVVYKGSKVLGDKGETVRVRATVKEHGERDGVAQTIIARPAILADATPAPVPQDAPAAPVAPAIATPEVVEDARPVRGSLSALVAQVQQAKPQFESEQEAEAHAARTEGVAARVAERDGDAPHCHRCGTATVQHVPYCETCLTR